MKRTWPVLLILAALSTAPLISAPKPATPPAEKAPAPAIKLPPATNTAFKAGEKLEFVIKYEFVGAGTATMEVIEGPLMAGRPTLNVISRAKSTNFIDGIFKVRDFNGAFIDKESLASVHFHQNLKEGKYHVVRNTAFDYVEGTYTYERIYKGKTKQRSGKLTQPVSDILSSFFRTRTLPLELGKEYAVDVFSDEEIYPLAVKVSDKLEKIKVPAGTFECIRLEPAIKGDAIFKAREGRMTIWLTNDARRMPVLIRSKVAVGSFDAELKKFTN